MVQKTNKEKGVVGRDVECQNCNYVWRTQSKMYVATCPRCHCNVRIGMDFDEALIFDLSSVKGYNTVEKV